VACLFLYFIGYGLVFSGAYSQKLIYFMLKGRTLLLTMMLQAILQNPEGTAVGGLVDFIIVRNINKIRYNRPKASCFEEQTEAPMGHRPF